MKPKYIFFLFIIVCVTSCSKDWLKPDPLSFYTPGNVFVDKQGFEAALATCKKLMNAENHGLAPNDNYISAEFQYSDLAVELRQSDFTKNTPSTSQRAPILVLFLNAYEYIKNANTIISRIDDIEWAKQEDKNRILSEALWFRSYWYYRLVNTYGDIPWVGEELNKPRYDYKSTKRPAILLRLQKDLEFAVANLPVTAANGGDVTKGAANHLLAKVYLANNEFDKAIAAATEVIDGPYALMTSRFGSDGGKAYYNVLWDLHRCENKSIAANKESIYTTIERPDAPPGTWFSVIGTCAMRAYGPSYWKVPDSRGNRATNWNTRAGDSLGIGNGDVRVNHFYMYWLWKDGAYTWQNTPDLRRANSNWIDMGEKEAEIITVNPISPELGKPLTKAFFANLNDTVDTWFSWPFHKIYVPTPNWHQPYGGQGDWYIFRLAETYLLRAEAYYYKGQLGSAADDINKVRSRAKASLISSADVSLDLIFDERARELFAEEPRHSEMVRVSYILAGLNRDGYSLATISQKNWYHDRVMKYNHFYHPPIYSFWGNQATLHPNHMLWPIPQTVITANTLGRINQNNGYDGAELNEPPLETIPE